MARIAGEIVINSRIETVFDFIADERNVPPCVFKLITPLIKSVGEHQEKCVKPSLEYYFGDREKTWVRLTVTKISQSYRSHFLCYIITKQK